MPVRRETPGAQPSLALISVLSLLRPRTPFGASELVVTLQLDAGDLFDDVDELVDGDQFVAAEIDRLADVASACSICVPLRQSSMYMKLRVCSPSPQISISCLPEMPASIPCGEMAAGAFSRPPSQVP